MVLANQGEFDPIDLKVIPRNGLPVNLSRLFSHGQGASAVRAADRLFAALDGCEIRTFGLRFDLEVFSVTDQSTGRWLQIGLKGVLILRGQSRGEADVHVVVT